MRYLDKHTARDKLLLKLERECHRLWQAQRDAPIVPLEHPYQRGWVKTYVLRNDALHHPDVGIFRTVLAVVNQKVHSRHRDFINRRGEEMELHPRKIRIGDWRKLAWPASHQRLFAFGHWRADEESWMPLRLRKLLPGFKLVRTWWMREDVQPFLITHQRVELPAVRKRLAEIESFMERTCGRRRLDRLHGRKNWWHIYDITPVELRARGSHRQQIEELQCEGNTPD